MLRSSKKIARIYNSPLSVVLLSVSVALAGCVPKKGGGDAGGGEELLSEEGAIPLPMSTTVPIETSGAPGAPGQTAFKILSPASPQHISNSSSLAIQGSCMDGETVSVSGDASTSAPCANSRFEVQVATPQDGTYHLVVKQSGSTETENLVWVRDQIVPAVPVIDSPAQNPTISKTTALAITGSCEAGALVSLSGDATESSSCMNGRFSLNASRDADGSYSFYVNQKDAAGNVSPAVSLSWVRDTVAPQAPTISSPLSNPITSNDNKIELKGGCEEGATVILSTGTSEASVSCELLSYSFELLGSEDGVYSYVLSQTDAAGNLSPTRAFTWIRDTTAPSAPSILVPALNPYYSNGNSIVLSGACVNGAIVQLSGDSAGSMTCASSSYNFNISKTFDGAHKFALRQVDAAGNASAYTNFQWVRDTVVPAVPSLTQPASNPFTSGDDSVVIAGSCENNAMVKLSGSTDGSVVCAGSAYSFSSQKNVDGDYSYSIVQVDRAGNTSLARSLVWSRDTTVPASPVLVAPATSPFYSNGSSLVIRGSCVGTHSVTLGGDVLPSEVSSPQGSLTQTCASNSFSFTVNKSADGNYQFTLKQSNDVPTDSAQVQLNWIRDTVAPAVPTITNPATNPFRSSGNLLLSGGCENGATVLLEGDETQQTTCALLKYSFNVSRASDGTYNFTVKQRDRAGNLSSTASLSWIKNTAVPATPVIASPDVNPYASNTASMTLNGSCDTGLTVTLGGQVTAAEVSSPAGSLSQQCVASSFSFTISKASDGVFDFNVKQTNGGIDSGAASMTWNRDTTPPETLLGAQPANPNLGSIATVSFSSDDPDAEFECKLDNEAYASCESPMTYVSLSNGSHTFYVRAKDEMGNLDPTPASSTWIQSSYNTIALYHFDTASGPYVDSSLYAGSANNSLTEGKPGSASTSASGKFAEGRSLNSANAQFLSKEDTASQQLLRDTMTVDLWVKFSSGFSNGDIRALVSKMGAANNYGWELKLKRQGSNYLLIFAGSLDGVAAPVEIKSSNCGNPGTSAYQHYAVTWNKGSVKLYCNGASKGSGMIGAAGSARLHATTAPLRVGATDSASGVQSLNGVVDELRLSQVLRWTTGFNAGALDSFTAD